MNENAERHLAKAEVCLTKGDGFYRKAAEHIVAAKATDPDLSNRQIAKRFDRSEYWVRELVAWITTAMPESQSPNWTRGSHATKKEIEEGARKLLASAPMELVERLVDELPQERKKQVAAAAGHGYLKAREDLEDRERNLTPLQRKEREATAASIDSHAAKLTAGFSSMSISGHLEQATEDLHELVAEQALTPETWGIIRTAIVALLEEAQVAAAMVGLELGLEAPR